MTMTCSMKFTDKTILNKHYQVESFSIEIKNGASEHPRRPIL